MVFLCCVTIHCIRCHFIIIIFFYFLWVDGTLSFWRISWMLSSFMFNKSYILTLFNLRLYLCPQFVFICILKLWLEALWIFLGTISYFVFYFLWTCTLLRSKFYFCLVWVYLSFYFWFIIYFVLRLENMTGVILTLQISDIAYCLLIVHFWMCLRIYESYQLYVWVFYILPKILVSWIKNLPGDRYI